MPSEKLPTSTKQTSRGEVRVSPLSEAVRLMSSRGGRALLVERAADPPWARPRVLSLWCRAGLAGPIAHSTHDILTQILANQKCSVAKAGKRMIACTSGPRLNLRECSSRQGPRSAGLGLARPAPSRCLALPVRACGRFVLRSHSRPISAASSRQSSPELPQLIASWSSRAGVGPPHRPGRGHAVRRVGPGARNLDITEAATRLGSRMMRTGTPRSCPSRSGSADVSCSTPWHSNDGTGGASNDDP